MKTDYPQIKSPDFKNILFFEINSLIGRILFKHKSKIKQTNAPLLIDIGAGRNHTDGWLHVDFYKTRLRKFWKKYQFPIPDVETDFRYPLNAKDNIADGVYSGHTLEHLYPNHAYNLLRECYRVLKPGAWIRINVPDLKRAIDFYNGNIEMPHFKFKAEAIGHLTQNHGHVSVWDEELLCYALESVGFTRVRKVEFGTEGTDKRLIKEEEYRKEETLVVEGQKPN